MEENARLTELTRMLLSSSAFAGFMNELSIEQAPRSQEQPAPPPTSLQPNTRKDVNPHQVNQQQPQLRQQQIGFALMPDIDFSSLDLNTNGWNSGIDMTFNNTQVFAVTEVPQGPAVDTGILSGKTSNFVPSFSSSDDSKDQVPVVERAPTAEKVEETAVATPCEDVEFDESDPAFALFSDASTSKPAVVEPFEDMFGGVAPEKVFSRIELVIDEESADQETVLMERFERMLSSIEQSFQRIGNITSHLR
jgi:bZIP-type transcription factor MBZ1